MAPSIVRGGPLNVPCGMPSVVFPSTILRAQRFFARRFPTTVALLVGAIACEPLLLSPSQYGELRVTITTEAGAPVPDTPITLYTGARPIEYSRTDESGSRTFERVPPGNYGVLGAMPAGMCNPNGSSTLVQDDLDVVPSAQRLVSFTIRPCLRAVIAPEQARH